MKWLLGGWLMLVSLAMQGQTFRHYDFLGAGHDKEIMVTTSSNSGMSSGQKTVDGFPIQNMDQLKDASRFLAQATFGADMATIEMTAAMGYEAWLEEQFNLPRTPILAEMVHHNQLYGDREEEDDEIDPLISHITVRSAWMTQNLSNPDILRQRLKFNWLQLMVVNDESDFFEDVGNLLGGYYDLLGKNSFGNYRDLLLDVTLSPSMGVFLSHYNNPKEDPINNIHPDENYAREIMQLFSIGLWELNKNGTRKYDNNGQFIPTYSNANIKEFAQVFTGLGPGFPEAEFGLVPFEYAVAFAENPNLPMKMFENFHDRSSKQLLNGVVLPANQNGMTDINQTIDHLANHPNTAPFICQSMIKMLTTSNPSPQYVLDVVNTFDPHAPNNFQEVIKAILLHPEARTCNITNEYNFGKLREPVVRLLNLLKSFHISTNEFGDYASEMYCYMATTGQSPFESPSVFNFFLPDYQPPGPITQNYLVAPEFQILNTTNAIGIINDVNHRTVKKGTLSDICPGEEEEENTYDESDEYLMDFTTELELTNNPAALVERLNIILANGLLTGDTRNIIINAINQLDSPEDKLKMALYLILIAPDYVILK